MAKRSRTPSFEVSYYAATRVYKLVVRTALGVYKDYLPVFPFTSAEFAGLEQYYGNVFMMHVVPEKYGFQHNVIKTKGCVQVRYTDFSQFGVTKAFLAAALSFWKDSAHPAVCRRTARSLAAFRELSEFRAAFLAMPVPGLEGEVSRALGKARAHHAVLVLVEPEGTLFYRSTEEVHTKEVSWDFFSGAKCYYLRPWARRFLKRLKEHQRVVLRFYTSLSEFRCTLVLPFLSAETAFFASTYCGRESPRPKLLSRIWATSFAITHGFGHHNTILVESNYSRCEHAKKGLVLVPPYDLHQLQHCPSKLPLQHAYEYLNDVLANSDYDVGEYIRDHPFTSYS